MIVETEEFRQAADAERRFADAQVEMTRQWFENLRRSGVDINAHIAQRRAAYLDRWREAGRFIPSGSRVLDIGGGMPFEDLFAYFAAKGWNYSYVDIGADEVAEARRLGAQYGIPPHNFVRALNHEMDYPPGAFDAVFSSHCIEHSMHLTQSLIQINRMLRDGGMLTVAVPLGWEPNPNHPYFLLEEEWLTLIEDVGFEIRTFQIGREYPENGYDLFVAARKISPPKAWFRIDTRDYEKSNFSCHDFRIEKVALVSEVARTDGYVLLDGPEWKVRIEVDPGVREVLPIFVRHDWSAQVLISSGAERVYADLFRQNRTTQPVRLRLAEPAIAGQIIEITPTGRSPVSFGAQGAFCGYMTR